MISNSSSYHILVVDDDTRLRDLLTKYLKEQGFYVSCAKDAAEAREQMKDYIFDLLVVDVMMPNENGIEFTKSVRKTSKVPVLMLTAMGESSDRITGLESGADDYLTKPFEPKELLLRINNILKRVNSTKKKQKICKFGDFTFDTSNLQLHKREEAVHLTEAEAQILQVLCKEMGSMVPREILANLCGDISDRSIDVQITRLRKKIEVNPKSPLHLQTVRGYGYVLYN